MTYINAKVLYKHRLSLGKSVDDILKLYPQLAEEEKEKKKNEKPKRRAK